MPISGELTHFPGNMGQGPPGVWSPYPNHVNTSTEEPGSVRWWLAQGIGAISAKQTWFKIKEDYVLGPQPSPSGDKRYIHALKDLQDKTQTNYVQLVVNSPVQRMRVKGFRFGDSQADEEAERSWRSNEMDFKMEELLFEAAVYGEAYLLVSPAEDDSGQPIITTEHPRVAHVFPDPVNPTRSLCAIRLWKDEYENRVIAVVYLPEATYSFIGPKNSAELSLINNVDNYEFVISEPNLIGEVNLIRVPWRSGCRGEADDIFSIQDRINHTVLDRLLIAKYQAYPQRWGTGVSGVNKKRKGHQKAPFDPGTDTLWLVPDPDAKLGQFDQADIRQLLEAIRDDVIDMATLTQTPAHYLMGKMSNVGGDTLTQAESGFVAKVRTRQRSVGWALERAMRLVFLFQGNITKAKEIDAEVIWADPEVRTRAEQADAALKEAQVFAECPPFAIPVVAERLGLEPDQIKKLVEAAEKWQQDQADREMEMLEKQNENAIAVAKEGGRVRPASVKQSTTGSSK